MITSLLTQNNNNGELVESIVALLIIKACQDRPSMKVKQLIYTFLINFVPINSLRCQLFCKALAKVFYAKLKSDCFSMHQTGVVFNLIQKTGFCPLIELIMTVLESFNHQETNLNSSAFGIQLLICLATVVLISSISSLEIMLKIVFQPVIEMIRLDETRDKAALEILKGQIEIIE